MNYNYIAPFYDGLSRICFLNRQQNAHHPIIPYLKNNMKILWLGGGSGWFLEEMDKLKFQLEIDYVEISSVMMNAAQARVLRHVKVNYIQQDVLKFYPTAEYDLIITAFIFDHFKVEQCQQIFNQIYPKLKNKGLWFYVDFIQNQNFIQRVLTRSMVLFFNIVAGIKNQDFPKIEYLFDAMKKIEEKFYFGNYIVSRIYQK